MRVVDNFLPEADFKLAQALMNVGIIKDGDVVLNLETGMLIPIQTKRN